MMNVLENLRTFLIKLSWKIKAIKDRDASDYKPDRDGSIVISNKDPWDLANTKC